MNEFSEEKIERIRNYDFFAKCNNPVDFEADIKSHLLWGIYKKAIPKITVIITTYKRPETLRLALKSAINQIGFDDYEILVADNEGVMPGILTDTEKIIREYNCDKVLYYRHEKEMIGRTTRAVKLARTKWFCILHDDDLLVENHLFIMNSIVSSHPEISYLACKSKGIPETLLSEDFRNITKAEKGKYHVSFQDAQVNFFSFRSSWLGAFIDREKFISNGGMDDVLSSGIGDYIMAAKFSYYYDIYMIDLPLYCYRIWNGQVSSSGAIQWLNCYISEYYLYRYMASKCNVLARHYLKKMSEYRIINKVIGLSKEPFKIEINLEDFKKKCHIEINEKRRLKAKIYISIYERYFRLHLKKLKKKGFSGTIK